MNSPKLTLKEITSKNWRDIVKLSVTEKQKKFVAPNVYSIVEAHYSDHAWFRAIYADDTPVGFIMVSIDKEKSVLTIIFNFSTTSPSGNFPSALLKIDFAERT